MNEYQFTIEFPAKGDRKNEVVLTCKILADNKEQAKKFAESTLDLYRAQIGTKDPFAGYSPREPEILGLY